MGLLCLVVCLWFTDGYGCGFDACGLFGCCFAELLCVCWFGLFGGLLLMLFGFGSFGVLLFCGFLCTCCVGHGLCVWCLYSMLCLGIYGCGVDDGVVFIVNNVVVYDSLLVCVG